MKLFTTVFIAVFAMAATTMAAEKKHAASSDSSGGGTSAGFHAGVNLANVGGDLTGSTKLGFKFGGQVEFQMGDWFFLQPELAFTMKGSKASATDVKLNLNYIELPILMKAKFDAGGWWPYIVLGPSIGIAMSRNLDGVDASTTYKSLNFGLSMGAGAAIPVGDGMSWFLDGRYELGLANILESAFAPLTGKANNISFNTGLSFAI